MLSDNDRNLSNGRNILVDMFISNHGTLFLLEIGGKVTILLVCEKECNLHEMITAQYSYIMKIIKGLQDLV